MMQPRTQAVQELEAELSEFSYDGLTLLRRHLDTGKVLRGSWAGCVISYKRGAAGSTRRDRNGLPRNAFTTLWDGGWITDEEVLQLVDIEVARRRPSAGVAPRPDEFIARCIPAV
jgi:hypothetical protein